MLRKLLYFGSNKKCIPLLSPPGYRPTQIYAHQKKPLSGYKPWAYIPHFRYLVFHVFLSLLMVFHLLVLASVVPTQKTSTEQIQWAKLTESWSALLTQLVLEAVERFIIKIDETGYFNDSDITNSTFFFK